MCQGTNLPALWESQLRADPLASVKHSDDCSSLALSLLVEDPDAVALGQVPTTVP